MLVTKTFLSSVLFGASALSLSMAAPALAQTAAQAAKPAETPDVATVVVTARRTEERLQDVPISITVFNQQSLANSNVVSAEDLAKITPSLSANTNFGSDNSSFAIRGFIQENGTAPSVGVYFADVVAPRGPSNGTPAGDGAGAGSFFDLQNVQVLKGPQGTLEGRNTTGGSVLLVPQKPTGRNEGYVEASYGNYDLRRLQAVVNVPISDNLRFRFGFDDQKRDGYLNNESGIGPKHLDNVNYKAIRASLVWDITPDLENYSIASYSYSQNYGDVQKMIAKTGGALSALTTAAAALTPGFYDVLNGEQNPRSVVEQYQLINTTTWKPSDNLTVKNIVSYAELRDETASSLFGVVLPDVYNGVTYPTTFTENHSIPNGDSAHESTFSEEFRLSGTALNDRLTWQGGLYSEISLPIGVVGAQSSFLASCTNSSTFACTDSLAAPYSAYGVHVGSINLTEGQTSFYDYGIYSQETYKITEQLKLTGGFRYTWDHESDVSTQESFYLDYPTAYGVSSSFCTQKSTDATNCVNHLYEDSSAPTWLVDLDYTPTKDLLIYGKYSRGYRSGGIAPNVSAPLNTFKPEKVDSYEIGFKSTFHAPVKATFDMSFFYNDFTNQQIQIGFNANQTGYASTAAPVNIPGSTIYGLEVSGSINPVKGLAITAGYTYLHTRIDSAGDIASLTITGYTLSAPFNVGDPIALTPENKAVVDVSYTLPFVSSDVGKITFGGTFSHTDKELANYSDRTLTAYAAYSWLPATDLLDLHASWNSIYGKPVDVQVFATNVTGQKYYTSVPGIATAGLGFETIALGQPTMYGVRLKYHW